jgi:hypothetical protein
MGPFFVPLVMAYVTMVLAFLLGASGARGATGAMGAIGAAGWSAEASAGADAAKADAVFPLLAAVLVAVDPLMVDYGMQPMSDVPAACWLVAAVWLMVDRRSSIVDRPSSVVHRRRWTMDDGRWTSILAGVCAGMAFLTRNALLPAAIAIGVVTFDRPLKESLRYAAALLAFVVLQMAINVMLYGNARTSGYGPTSYMFDLSGQRLAANAANFGKWLTFSHTFLIWPLWPAALWVLRRRRWAWQISVVAAAAAAPYLFYLVFDDWESARFLLPTILLVLILSAVALGEAVAALSGSPPSRNASGDRRGRTVIPIGVLALAVACAAASHRFLWNEGVYRFRDVEAKYSLAGEWIDTHFPPRAIFLAGLHSGSIRYYGHRQTIRWDEIPPDQMSATLHNLELAGYEPYLALDVPSEPPLFDERFRQDSAVRIEQIGRVRVVNVYRFVSAH